MHCELWFSRLVPTEFPLRSLPFRGPGYEDQYIIMKLRESDTTLVKIEDGSTILFKKGSWKGLRMLL